MIKHRAKNDVFETFEPLKYAFFWGGCSMFMFIERNMQIRQRINTKL